MGSNPFKARVVDAIYQLRTGQYGAYAVIAEHLVSKKGSAPHTALTEAISEMGVTETEMNDWKQLYRRPSRFAGAR